MRHAVKAGNARVDGVVDASELAKLSAVELLEGYRAKPLTSPQQPGLLVVRREN